LSESLLLDTHVVIWVLFSSDKLSGPAKRAMSRPGTDLFVSVVSVWEIILKHRAGKLLFQIDLTQVVNQILYSSPWSILPISPEHLPLLSILPILHKDPFDRLLIAQARNTGLSIVTADKNIKAYGVRTIW
jgi:PIN domain nuclease of toxin-antitoxin system